MKTLIIGAGPLGSLYTYLFKVAGVDVTLLARNSQYNYLKEIGLSLVNEFTNERMLEKISVTDSLSTDDNYDLVIVIMRKNNVESILPTLSKNKNIKNILFMGNNAAGFDQYVKYLDKEKILIGFPGGGGSRIQHVAHYIDSEEPNGDRMPVVIGELDGVMKERTKQVIDLFESSEIPVKFVEDIDSWLKYHAVFVNPIAGALIAAGDNYQLAKNTTLIKMYIKALKEGGSILRELGYKKSYNPKFNLIKMMPEWLTANILQKVFNSKFAEIAMMMHVNAARDEMIELGKELMTLKNKTSKSAPNLESLIQSIN
jgi:2-dehydropantoate 2-reductase